MPLYGARPRMAPNAADVSGSFLADSTDTDIHFIAFPSALYSSLDAVMLFVIFPSLLVLLPHHV